MTHPKGTICKMVLLSCLTGKEVDGNTPRWVDRKFGWTPKQSRGRKQKKRKRAA